MAASPQLASVTIYDPDQEVLIRKIQIQLQEIND